MQCQNETNKQGAHDCSVEFDPKGRAGSRDRKLNKTTMANLNMVATTNASEIQNPKGTSNEDFFEIDIMEELKFEYDECEESTELSKLLLKF